MGVFWKNSTYTRAMARSTRERVVEHMPISVPMTSETASPARETSIVKRKPCHRRSELASVVAQRSALKSSFIVGQPPS